MLYPKIYAPFKRHTNDPGNPLRNKLDVGNWLRPEFELLKDMNWEWTEKVNGTNVRVMWDGYRVRFGGRGNDAQMPIKLLETLKEMFPEELMEQQFGQGPAVLFGEGYGPNVADGSGVYGSQPGFVLFDVVVRDAEKAIDWWLLREKVVDVAQGLGIGIVPVLFHESVDTALRLVRGGIQSAWGNFPAEGIVGKPPLGIMGRDGDRLMMKIKAKDFL